MLPAALTLDALHKKAMALERAGWGKKAAADRAAKATLKQWQAANHQAVADMGHLAGAGHSLQPCPVGVAGSLVRWASHEGDRGQSAIRLVSLLHASKEPTNFSDALVNDLAFQSRTLAPTGVLEGESMEKALPSPTKKKPTCSEAGICLCSAAGRRLWLLHCRFIDMIKRAFPASGSLRSTLLKHSGIFVSLHGRPITDARDCDEKLARPRSGTLIFSTLLLSSQPFGSALLPWTPTSMPQQLQSWQFFLSLVTRGFWEVQVQ